MIPTVRDPGINDIALLCVRKYAKDVNAYLLEVMQQALSGFYTQILNAEFLAHLGYSKSSGAAKVSDNRRNGFIHKKVKSSLGTLNIPVPRDRDGSFAPISVKKHIRSVVSTESKVLTMYGRGMSDEDVLCTLEDIYGSEVSAENLSVIKKKVLLDIKENTFSVLSGVYAFVLLFNIDLFIRGRAPEEVVQISIVAAHGVNHNGGKELLDLYITPPGPKASCSDMLKSLNRRGVNDIAILTVNGINVQEEEVKHLYPNTLLY